MHYTKPALEEGKNICITGGEGIGKSVYADVLAQVPVEDHELVLVIRNHVRIFVGRKEANSRAVAQVRDILLEAITLRITSQVKNPKWSIW